MTGLLTLVLLLLVGVGSAGAEPGMFFPLVESQRLLQALDERDQFKIEVEALKALDGRNQALIEKDQKIIQGQDLLLQMQDKIIESKDRLIRAHETERDYWKKRAEQAEPGFFAPKDVVSIFSISLS